MSTSLHYPTASLKPHRSERLEQGHLWIFSGALQQPPHWIEPGGLVDVKSATGQFVARGYYNPRTDIAIRILTYDPAEEIDLAFLRRRIRRACELRAVFDPAHTNAYRLINAEGDGLPGLVVDRYAEVLVVQIHTSGMQQLCPLVIDALLSELRTHGILVRNDSQGRVREGLAVEEPLIVAGAVPTRVTVRENDVLFVVDPWAGQKTGFFLDQRDKREALRKYSRGKRVLNCFSYSGAFSVYAALSDSQTRTVNVDVSAPALEAAREHFVLNGLDPAQHEFHMANVFDYLEEARRGAEQFDVVVLDPPAFAKTQSVRAQALKAYRRLNQLALEVLRPGGILLTCSCSGVVGMDDLLGVLALGARHCQRQVQVLEVSTHGVDHPLHLAMPETAYLKAIFCRVQ
ncbi:MAG TPA: class I SAM-dependent rRNA methyltransferase [Ktedonobacteraceae bacterium]